MALTAAQRKVARQFARAVRRTNASPMLTEALYEAGLVESNLTNVAAGRGDRDSVGPLQQRPSQGWTGLGNPYKAALEFIHHGKQLQAGGFKGSSGDLAQAIQRSAYPDRYEQQDARAGRLVDRYVRGAGGSQAPSTPTVAGGSPFDPGEVQGLASLVQVAQKPQRPTASGPAAPAFSGRNALPMAGQQVMSSAPRAAKPDLSSMLEQVKTAAQSLPAVQASASPQPSRSGGGSGRPGKGLVGAVQNVDQLAARFGAPITAKQEPGHAAGGDHDPAVKGATARDIGGDEQTRERIFRRITRQLGVKGAVYKGQDINVVRGGVRYQIISRDHGTGPHLHIGLRRVS